MERGKFLSLTMINWNGFFARTFDLDELVTTFSGGNGAGKSTAMASFVTALIPDQNLLHFRNTTEAGSANASRDKGLYGKLKPGTCYAALEVMNSRQQRLVFAVKLQQVAGRDKKVDIKAFMLQDLPEDLLVSEIFIEPKVGGSARVRPYEEMRDFVSDFHGLQFKAFNAITDYHNQMFEMGVLAKKLRNQSDRGKYYRLIEASLYGGISSTITRSLRDYLLPHNSGVKKAFQDMEAALRENRLTLEAIKVTQADRDLFKHLLRQATDYVAADYMRHVNERQQRIDGVLKERRRANEAAYRLNHEQHKLNELSIQSKQEQATEEELEVALDNAHSHYQRVQSAYAQQQKVDRYQEDLFELSERLEEQTMVVEEAQESLVDREMALESAESEVDSLQRQLADYQQALNAQQTRALQYKQANEALEQATAHMGRAIRLEDVGPLLSRLRQQQQQDTQSLLEQKHQLELIQAGSAQFDAAYQLVLQLDAEITREQAQDYAKSWLESGREHQARLLNADALDAQHRSLERAYQQYQQAQQLRQSYLARHGVDISDEASLIEAQTVLEAQIEELTTWLDELSDKRSHEQELHRQAQVELQSLQQQAPAWVAANDALEILTQQLADPRLAFTTDLCDAASVMGAMQHVLDYERDAVSKRDTLAAQKQQLESDIIRLAQPGGSDDSGLQKIAEQLGGQLLSEIYEDISIDDAPYFSAMYGPARHAVVVRDIEQIKPILEELSDCPDDLYLIEGDANAFDDSSFSAEELRNAVCVRLNNRQLRYSRYPEIPLFGRAAREQQLELLREQREACIEQHAIWAFDAQKWQRLHHHVSDFVATHLNLAFTPDPEPRMRVLRKQMNDCDSRLAELNQQANTQRQQLQAHRLSMKQLAELGQMVDHLEAHDRADYLAQSQRQWQARQDAHAFFNRYGKVFQALNEQMAALAFDPQLQSSLEAQVEKLDRALQQLKSQLFALSEVDERRAHFQYHDAEAMVAQSSDLDKQLKLKWAEADKTRHQCRADLKLVQQKLSDANQVMAALRSAHQAKKDTIDEFVRDIQMLGVRADALTEQEAKIAVETLTSQLATSRRTRSALEKAMTAAELEVRSQGKLHQRAMKEYRILRGQGVSVKSNWSAVMRVAKDSDVDRRLQRREFAYMSAEELRSRSDKALGALRLAVADNETLRDALRHSEDMARPERKVLFYIAVYQHLKDRIRHDIIRSDDPVEAIEEMEVELARLTEELSQREVRLAISAESVANIIRQTIVREQNRIRQLNQGLQRIGFGQVNGVRLNVKVRDSHLLLLTALSEHHRQHQDLFGNQRLTFSEAIAKLFQRLNPHIDVGQKSAQVLGEALLDYRNYLDLSIEVNRGSDGWLQAESGALSTGEAIGTGQAILLMVVQSWEEESRRLRAKDIVPCRLLFLDEAARLDARSIATLFELCERLDMQLLIAAPENISPEKGTTYKLMRKIIGEREHVHVVGLKGFADVAAPSLPSEQAALDATQQTTQADNQTDSSSQAQSSEALTASES
ncbi:chromosome partition protein MukB [Vibrio stylophorae]